ncbi:MAG: hypothetical protein VX768_16605 [Planctomycetota bacterium]|nr:hypothetical protein [Planctomycetota bacterium]
MQGKTTWDRIEDLRVELKESPSESERELIRRQLNRLEQDVFQGEWQVVSQQTGSSPD